MRRFIATHEARAAEGYKRMIVDSRADDIVYTNLFSGIHGNYLRGSIAAAGLNPENLPVSEPSKMDFGGERTKAWNDIWGSGQGIGAISEIASAGQRIAVLKQQYEAARARLAV